MSQIRLNQNSGYDFGNNNPLLEPQHPSLAFNAPWQKPAIEIEDPRVVQRLVNNLMYLFNITSGDYLTFILGQGHCTKNEDALKYWVLDQLEDHHLDSADVLHYLVEHLQEQLNQEVYS
ncbi:hypothetical protein [Thiosulfativibrio zosterae]|nr:hypothetical protein [Thiosulfativibrio zosterae]